MRQETGLRPSLTLFQVVYLGLAWMTPMIYFSIYGIAYRNAQGMLTQAYLLAFAAIFFTAVSYSIMSRTFPASGSAYTYTAKSIHPQLGFLVGWALLLDYLFSPLIACLTFGISLHTQFPAIPASVWMISFNAAIAAISISGIRFSASLSRLFVLVQLVFIAVFCLFLIRNLLDAPSGSLHPLQPVLQTAVSFPAIMTGASIICFSFLGFDSITTLSEETIRPDRTIPRAIMIIIVSACVMYVVPSYLTQLAFPRLTFADPDSAGFDIVRLAGGAGLGALFVTVLVMAIFTQGLSSVTSVSRLLYVMGREHILPQRFFAYIHPVRRTPVYNIVIVSALSLLSLTVSLDTAVKFVNFGALTSFVFVNLCVVAQRYVKDRQRSPGQTIRYLLFPLAGAGFIGWLLTLLDHSALIMGLVWLACGAVYRLLRTGKLRQRVPAADRADRPQPAALQE